MTVNRFWVMVMALTAVLQQQDRRLAAVSAFVPAPVRACGLSGVPGASQVRRCTGPLRSRVGVVDTTTTRPGRQRRRRYSDECMTMQAEGRNLFECIQDEDVDSLRTYVERGGPVHVADALGDTSLLVAASTGNVDVMKVLTSAEDADVNYPCFHGGETPLMVACTQGHLRLVEFLVNEVGADVNAMNHRGDTALSLAAFWGRLDCLKLLLSLPYINTEIQNIQGKRAGEGMEELMRDESNDEETVALLRESRINQGITRL